MKIRKDILLPKIPADATPDVIRFCEELVKAIYEINRSIHEDMKNLAVPVKRTGGARDAVAAKPENPSVGTIYFEDDDGTAGHVNMLGVCTGFDSNDDPIWLYAELNA